MIRFHCPACSAILTAVDIEHARQSRCDHCGESLEWLNMSPRTPQRKPPVVSVDAETPRQVIVVEPRKGFGYGFRFGCGVIAAIATAIFALFLIRTALDLEASKTTLYVIHIGDKPDGYFKGLIPAKNVAGVEMEWTTKDKARQFTREEAESTIHQMQRIAEIGGFKAILRMESID